MKNIFLYKIIQGYFFHFFFHIIIFLIIFLIAKSLGPRNEQRKLNECNY
jgi:hypothetical protein